MVQFRIRAAAIGAVLFSSVAGAQAGQQPSDSAPSRTKMRDVVFGAENPRQLDELLAPIREKRDLPALAGAIISTGQLVAVGAVGVRQANDGTAVTADDKFHLGSCTKSMTATLVATFVEEGALSWTTTLEQALPDLAPKLDAAYRSVTIEQLLTHRAGVPTDLQSDGLWARLWNHKGTPTEQRATLAEAVLTRPPVHAPGGKYLYANAGFAIAGYICEVKSGKAWEDLMHERLFKPLQMTSAGFGAPGSADTIDQPRGHRDRNRPVVPGKGADNPAAIGPGGTVHCTLADWGRYIALHLRGQHADQAVGNVVIRRETFRKMHEPVRGQGADYAMGWGVTTREWAGKPGMVLTHSGSNTMWYCVCWLAPEREFAVISATNAAGDAAAKGCDDAAAGMIRLHNDGRTPITR